MFLSKKQKSISAIVFGIYLLLLTWLVLFKFATSLSELPHIRSINLIPFHYDQETSVHLKEVVYNFIVFVPLGVYVQIFKEDRNAVMKCMVAFLISFLFEAIQFIFAIGASDITDMIANTSGGIIGILFCAMMKRITPERFLSILNTLGILIEITAAGLLALLFAMNR